MDIQRAEEGAMKGNMRHLIVLVILGIGLGLMMPLNSAFADTEAFKQLLSFHFIMDTARGHGKSE